MENPKTPETLESKNPDLDYDKNEGSKEDNCLGINGVDSVKRIREDHIGVVVAGSDERLEERVDSGSEDNAVVKHDKNEGSKEDHCLGINGVDSVKRKQEEHIGVEVARSDERLEVRLDSGSEDNEVVEHAKNEGSKEDHCLGINGVDSVKKIQVSGDNISLYVDFSSFLCRLNDGVDAKKEDHIGVVAAGSDERLEVRMDGEVWTMWTMWL
ncbi:hypothetical protein F3Y22_tig00110933pilonHSYRG00100 [Hibiscus syriacus]|uniref:Uncharacterized protein n=1 Tax=Hibiscus syriacus TaxID=106335 RepID=A0A6A2ZCA9_HIBSY|nr:uncharacterized protein LOC120147141 [Hibiscus syriacus]KAE8689568.1 hypothetical protein F3Y22_tig00110933pilonHSYRG00100 [Hibiscus syriacus]